MAIKQPVGTTSNKRVIHVLAILAAFLILYTAISRLLNWDVYMGFLNYRIPLLLDRLGLSYIIFQLDINMINSWVTLISIFFTVVLLVTQTRYLRTRGFWLACIPLITLLIITGLSRLWSVAPGFTYSRYNLLLAGGLGGILIGLMFETRELRKILELFAAVLVIGSIFLVLSKPEVPTTMKDIRNGVEVVVWYGLFSWKMPAGMMMGFASVLFLFRLLDFNNEKWAGRIYGLFFFGLSFYMMYKSQSMTEVLAVAAVIFIIILGALYLKWGYLLRPAHWWILGCLAVIFILVVWFERGFFLGLINRGTNLTGRLPLWLSLIPAIKERFYFGYGFGEAFWKNSEYYQPIWTLFPDFLPVFAHNGFIEALMDNGIVGLLLWIVYLVQVSFLTLRYFFRERKLSALFFFSWVVFMVVMNVANNHLGSYETFTWLLLVISFATMVRDTIDRRKVAADLQQV